ncbi:MAG TPA: hypothetical protein VHV10_06370 [Ktedonobacteraceae bacterium]|nr:hypothetical protein [Ktedonobacteraceae bacterium]
MAAPREMVEYGCQVETINRQSPSRKKERIRLAMCSSHQMLAQIVPTASKAGS